MLARSAIPKFIADSNHDTETELSSKRRRIRPSRLDSSSSEDDLPVRKRSKATIPAPPPILSKKVPKAGRKGQGPSNSELNKLQREEVMRRLAAARAAAAAKMAGSKSPWKVTVSLFHFNGITCNTFINEIDTTILFLPENSREGAISYFRDISGQDPRKVNEYPRKIPGQDSRNNSS